MIVDGRPSASHRSDGAGNRGLERVTNRPNPGGVPPPTPSTAPAAEQQLSLGDPACCTAATVTPGDASPWTCVSAAACAAGLQCTGSCSSRQLVLRSGEPLLGSRGVR